MTSPQSYRRPTLLGRSLRGLLVVVGSIGLTLTFFLVLPLTQAVAEARTGDTLVRAVDAAALPPPPPPPPEEEQEEEPEPEEAPPEMAEESQPLDLSQLELALDPGGFGSGFMQADFEIKLNASTSAAATSALFALSDLEQKPRVIYQPAPAMNTKIRKKAPGTVWLIFVVDERGRVQNPKVQSSSDPVFERAALAAVKQWKFEPGKRSGEAVSSRMRIPITFPGSK